MGTILPAASPAFVVWKNGKPRVVVDLRKISVGSVAVSAGFPSSFADSVLVSTGFPSSFADFVVVLVDPIVVLLSRATAAWVPGTKERIPPWLKVDGT